MFIILNSLLFYILFYCHEAKAGTFSVDFTNHQFLKDGKPFRYLSGSIHYMRVHPDLWNDRLQRIRALGLNAIQVYVPWNLHEPTPGNFDFSGGLNLTNFITLAQQNGLYVLLRPGPYICAEWEFGGLPWWLLKYDGIVLRTHDKNYTNAVQNYYNKLLDVVQPLLYKNGGPILMIQVENEYGSDGHCDRNYTTFVRDLIWDKFGNDTVLYTTDPPYDWSLPCGVVPGVLATIDFGTHSDSEIDSFFALQDNYTNGGPNVVTEYWVSWFTMWGGQRGIAGGIIIDNLSHMYSKNASINIYMIHGGTNFGFMNGAETNGAVTTSYDYGAAIAENGDITQIYTSIYSMIKKFNGWEQTQLPVPSNNPASNYGQVTLSRIGTNLISTLTQIQESCTQSQDPLNFEQIDHGYGFVLYSTTLTSGGTNLTTPHIRDYGYVFVNNVYQGMLSRDNMTSLSISAQKGDMLRILVENRGRQTIPIINDLKGLHNNVTLNNNILQNWFQCGINLTKSSIDSLTTNFLNENVGNVLPEKASSTPGVFVGQFSASQLQDTFLDSTGWGKGQLFINGYNLGRYWPLKGPQMALYVPKPYIQQTNTILMIELVGSQQNYVNFVDHAIYK